MGMRLYDTPEMEKLWQNVEPYLDGHRELKEDAPEQIKKDYEEYYNLFKKQYDFAEKLNMA